MQGMKTLNNIKKIWGAALIGIASFMLQGCQEAAQKGDGLLMTGTIILTHTHAKIQK